MYKWHINIDGENYEVTFKQNAWSGKHKITVNGKDVPFNKKVLQDLFGIDQPINIGGKECRLVLIGNKPDIAVDGFFVDSKKPYKPLQKMPKWAWIFIIACFAIPIISLGGALPVVLAMFAAFGCAKVAVSPNLDTMMKVMASFMITSAAWGLFFMLLMAMSGII